MNMDIYIDICVHANTYLCMEVANLGCMDFVNPNGYTTAMVKDYRFTTCKCLV